MVARDALTLQGRFAELGIAATVEEWAVGATITPRTELAATALAPSKPQSRLPVSTLDLPRISLAIGDSTRAAGEPFAGTTRADLELRDTLGEGGMGRVHRARQRSLDRDVAVKTLKDAAPSSVADALLREARIMGSLEHPGIVPVHALGVDDQERPLIVMKRIDGVEWGALLRDPDHPRWNATLGRSFDPLTANLDILMHVCRAAHFAHSRGVIHRDIKPENVMLGEHGEVYLADWGIAIHARDVGAPENRGSLVGTPAYMAPEMVVGESVDARTDVYLLGATLHELLTGSYRHDGTDLPTVLAAAFASEPFEYGPDVPEELASLCNRAMARDPANRPATALEVHDAIVDYGRHRTAISLAEAAATRIDQLEALVSSAPQVGPFADLVVAYRLASEARFGFAESLREWPEHAAALAGRRRVAILLVELELLQENMSSARALLSELDHPPGELVERVDALERSVLAREAEQRALRALAHDLDPTVSAEQRARSLVGLVVLAASLSAWAIFGPGGPERLTAEDMLRFSFLILGVVLLGIGVFKRTLLVNAFNRRLTALLVFGALVLVASRLSGIADGWPVWRIMAQDLFALGLMTGAAAIMMLPALWATTAMLLIASLVCRLAPEQAIYVFTSSTVLNVVLIVWALRGGSVARTS